MDIFLGFIGASVIVVLCLSFGKAVEHGVRNIVNAATRDDYDRE